MMSAGQIDAQTRSFDLEAGNASTTLREFARQAKVSVVMDRQDVQGVQTNEVSGLLVPRVALERMLEGTPLVFKEDLETGAFAITRPELPVADLTILSSEVPTSESEQQPMEDNEMNAKKTNWLKWIAALLVIGNSSPVNGQEDNNVDDIFELSPFVVEDDDGIGYVATQTLAGTRLRSKLEDIGASVQVITSAFLDDIGATEANDLLLFTTGTETTGLGGNFSGGNALADDRVLTIDALGNPQSTNRIRGLGAPDNTRDFFLTDIPFDRYNTGRVEINRGANAILFGLGSPSGVLNSGLNRAVFGEINEIEFRVQDGGKHLSTRGSLDFNRVLIEDKLAVRVSGMQSDRNYSQEPAFQDQERYYVAATWRPLKNTTIRANYENGHIRANSPDSVGPLQAIDYYIENIGIYHAALRADTTPPDDGDEKPLVYDPFFTAVRAVSAPHVGVDNYNNQLGSGGFGNSLGMVFSGKNAEPDFGFPGVIAGGRFQDNDPSVAGFQVPPFYDAERPDGGELAPRRPTTSRFSRIDNEGHRTGVFMGFTDLELYNFADHLLGGTAPFQNRDFDAFNVNLEQTFFENKLGFELAFSEESLKNATFHGFPGRTMGVMVDINKTLTTGPEPNPNFGRPFMIGKTQEQRSNSDRKVYRWTGFGEFNTRDIFGDDSLWSTILGRHVVTGLASRQELDFQRISYSMREFGPREANLNENFGTAPNPRHFDYVTYIGPPVDLLSNPAGLTREDFIIDPDPITIQNIWAENTPPIPTTYWDRVTQQMVTFPIERRFAAINGELNGTTNDSYAAILQSFLFDENIVGTMGWRKDEVTNTLNNTPILTNVATPEQISQYGIVNLEYENSGLMSQNAAGEFIFEEAQITFVEEDIFSWGVVAKLPQEWNSINWLNHASLFYNSSSNFQPAPGREDHFGRQLPSPTGITEDYGINLTFLDNKFHVRLNKFEAAIKNANNPSVNRVYAAAGATAALFVANSFYNSMANEDFSEIDEDETSPTFGQLTNIPLAQAEALVDEYLDFFGVDINRQTGEFTIDDSNPRSAIVRENNWRPTFNEELGVVDGVERNQANATDTLDQVSEGYELELVANPAQGLRVLLNVAKVETAQSNIAPVMRNWIEEEFGPFHAGTPNNPSKFGALIAGSPTHVPAVFPEANTNQQNWNNGVVHDWEIIKAQEGTFSPEVRKWRYNGVVNYDFQEGFLKGFGTGFNVRYQSRVAVGFPIIPDAEGIPKPDISNPYFGPSEINWGLRFAYRKMIFNNKVNWRIQLNLSNIFSDKEDLIPVRFTDDGRLAQVRVAPPKSWVISNTFKF